MFLLFLVFTVLLVISATPLLGLFDLDWSLPLMIGLFVAFFIAGWALFIAYPLFS
ncbi:hypothetical protein [Microcoleus sp. FACHB-68]|jgi:hypothetical protein|uniref:hypothetical protein n=1 Tax=Microcoleus sp. FACHB-68 TaxID=2692826 RepID=UPI00168A3164|nr:hypothetical protein [Microcoleus sp. FACHB-68]MBD1940329.1 hypothetical protein [Microcoleus sp. FACHB-68]MBW4679036.1 hypothetical protein [Microcoleus vaginatus WJT46-NPBG5]